ncbi:ribonuclease III [Rhodocyclus purpureus]|uniref:ribonuclease III n=1 Tax=Rhodocyclus purpureus TaxID=1067 RepID=UPI00191439B1|nr:ribonuclease III [Rhodocyclus purpureus]MBK5915609.1 ribonuclease III [Rhodocyclus purpureus]
MSERRIEQALGHSFGDGSLLTTALTHRSHSSPHNERLEFLGDSVLNCVIARRLYERFPALPEGDLSRLRANLVRQETLHQLALSLSLGEQLRLGEGETRSGGRERPSILADALEALFGAIWLDAGFGAAEAVISHLYRDLLASIAPGHPNKDPKTRLQEFLQGRRLGLPKYTLVTAAGQAHAQQFTVACEIAKPPMRSEGSGASRRAAEQMAAERALAQLQEKA